MELSFRNAEETDIDSILDIYNYYILNTTANFFCHAVSRQEFGQVMSLGSEKYPTCLILDSDEIVGFCFLARHRKKEAYDRTAEIGVYLKPGLTGKGLGGRAVTFMEEVSRKNGIKVIVASISGENTGSIRMFEKMGYEKCAHYRQVGEKFGRIIDVVDYQKML